MKGGINIFGYAFLAVALYLLHQTNGVLDEKTQKLVDEVNHDGPFLVLMVPNLWDLGLFRTAQRFKGYKTVDVLGRRFRLGTVDGINVILTMSGLGMINAAVSTQLVLSTFKVQGIIHYGICGSANPSSQLEDLSVPQSWAHGGLWVWQRYGNGPKDALPREKEQDYTRKIGFLSFKDFTKTKKNNGINSKFQDEKYLSASDDNTLNNIWYQPEEIFYIDGQPEKRQHIFWIPVDAHYFQVAKSLEKMKLKKCLNATACLSLPQKVMTTDKGISMSMAIANVAYGNFLFKKFNVTAVEMESAAIALVCNQQKIPYIAFKSLKSKISVDSPESDNDNAADFTALYQQNVADVLFDFIKKVHK